MVVDHAHGLHVGVDDGRAQKIEAALLEIGLEHACPLRPMEPVELLVDQKVALQLVIVEQWNDVW